MCLWAFFSGIWVPSRQWNTNWELVWWPFRSRTTVTTSIFGELGWSWRCEATDCKEIQSSGENSWSCLSSLKFKQRRPFWKVNLSVNSLNRTDFVLYHRQLFLGIQFCLLRAFAWTRFEIASLIPTRRKKNKSRCSRVSDSLKWLT